MEFLQENFQIRDTDKTLDNSPTENRDTHQQSPSRQILEVNRQKESAASRHVSETKDTFLQSHERGRQESRQSTQTADREESTVVSDKRSLPQHPDDVMNISTSVIQNTSEERRYNIRSWLTLRKEGTVVQEKGIEDTWGLGRVAGML